MSWQKGIILNPNEQVLHSWEGNCERHHKAVVQQRVAVVFTTNKTIESKEIHSGTLVLTNHRLLWFERRGFLSKTERASFEIDLKYLQGITCGGTIAKWVSITDNQAEYIFHLSGVGKKEIEPFRDMILRQVEKVRATAMSSSPAVPTFRQEVIVKSVDLNELIRQVRDGGIIVVYRCPHCGGKLKVDKETNVETLTVCEYCGSEIETVDLAEYLRTALS